MIRKPKKMSVRRNQSREENEQLNSFKENLFGNLKDRLDLEIGLGYRYHPFDGSKQYVDPFLVITLPVEMKKSLKPEA